MAGSASRVIINNCNKAVYALDKGAYRVPRNPFGAFHCDLVSFSVTVTQFCAIFFNFSPCFINVGAFNLV